MANFFQDFFNILLIRIGDVVDYFGCDVLYHYYECFVGWLTVTKLGLKFMLLISIRFVSNPFDRFWRVKSRPEALKILNDPSFGRHGYVRTKDIKLHYVESGDRSSPLMLMLHGFPEFWYSWRHQMKEFSSDYWVVAVDMRGYGDSEKPTERANYKISILVEDILNLIAALGHEKCTLVAHDWGGIIGWYLALLHPSKVDCYVAMNTVHPLAYRAVIDKNPAQREKSWYVYFFQLPYLPELMLRMDDLNFLEKMLKTDMFKASFSDDSLEAYKYTFSKPGALTGPINYYRGNFLLGSRHILKGLGRGPSTPPTLILYGDNDKYLEPEIQKETARLVDNVTLVAIKGASHFVQQDDPESVNREMRLFFGGLAAERKVAEKLSEH